LSYELIALFMFAAMMALLLTGQRVFGVIGAVAVIAALPLWGTGGVEIAFAQSIKLMKWYPLLTLPMFIFMGYMLSESRIADDLYRMFHVWFGPVPGGLAIGTILLMVVISAMNGLSVAGMAIGATIALPELLRRGYDKVMITGVIQGGSSSGILIPPSVVLVLYGMIARQPVSQLWLAGVFPGLMMAGLFILYIAVRCKLQPHLGPAAERRRKSATPSPGSERHQSCSRRGFLPFMIFFLMNGPVPQWAVTSLVESSAVGALAFNGRGAHQGAADLGGDGERRCARRSASPACSCGSSSRRCVSAPCSTGWARCKAIENFFLSQLGLKPWHDPDPDAAELPADGHLSRRHGDAGDRRAALCAAGQGAWLRSGLVRHSLHDHLPDRLHDAALRL
jgi:hypothetical protein